MSAQKESSSVQLLRKIYFKTGTLFETDFERAEEMHKKEIEMAYINGQQVNSKSLTSLMMIENAESYYHETFGGEK